MPSAIKRGVVKSWSRGHQEPPKRSCRRFLCWMPKEWPSKLFILLECQFFSPIIVSHFSDLCDRSGSEVSVSEPIGTNQGNVGMRPAKKVNPPKPKPKRAPDFCIRAIAQRQFNVDIAPGQYFKMVSSKQQLI